MCIFVCACACASACACACECACGCVCVCVPVCVRAGVRAGVRACGRVWVCVCVCLNLNLYLFNTISEMSRHHTFVTHASLQLKTFETRTSQPRFVTHTHQTRLQEIKVFQQGMQTLPNTDHILPSGTVSMTASSWPGWRNIPWQLAPPVTTYYLSI